MLRPRRLAGAARSAIPSLRAFRAIVVHSEASRPDGPTATIQEFSSLADLPRQDADATVEVDVEFSTLNFKDGLILRGQKGVVREWPIVPGIDYAGRVARSRSPLFREGDKVVLTGNKAGQFFDGGYSERASAQVPSQS